MSTIVGNDIVCYRAEDLGDYEGSSYMVRMMGVLRIMSGNIRMTLLVIILVRKRTW
jgi:hypothetical protein